MKTLLATCFTTIAAFFLANTALANESFPPPAQATVLTFSSLGSGIDTEKYNEALAVIASSVNQGAIAQFKQTLWGREGERTLCVVAQEPEENARIVRELSKFSNMLVEVTFRRDCQ
jgi:hypothetical protein